MIQLGDPIPINMPVFNAGNLQAQAPTTTSGGGSSFLDSLVNFGTKVFNTAKTTLPVAKDLKSQIDALKNQTQATIQNIGSGSSQNTNNGAPQPKAGLSTGVKVAIGTGIVLLASGCIYLATRKKGLGEAPNETIDTSGEVVDSKLSGVKKRKKKK